MGKSLLGKRVLYHKDGKHSRRLSVKRSFLPAYLHAIQKISAQYFAFPRMLCKFSPPGICPVCIKKVCRGMKMKKTALLIVTGLAAFSLGFVVHPFDNYFEISKNMDVFGKLYREINAVYVDEVNPSQLMKVGIEAMLEELDPYTNFFSESQIEDFKVMSTGQYSGIGATVNWRDGRLLVTEIKQESPSIEAGLKAGDEILQIDDQPVDHSVQDLDEINNLLRGASGDKVKLKVRRLGQAQPLEIAVERKSGRQLNVPYYGMADEHIGYIILSGFTQDAGKEVAEATLALKKQDPQLAGIILDLRGNPGGLLNESVNVTNVFVPRGEMIVETRGRMEGATRQYHTRRNAVDTEIPLAVIVNSSSASASEIVSGTIQDLDRGVIVGTRSYGKGLVQNVRPLSYNTQLKVTIAKYYTPSGRCIQAIDYSHRNEDGSVGRIPDSLQTAFKTRNGRTVYDGGGIAPDLEVPKPVYQPVTQALLDQGLIFDFATQYNIRHESIPPVKDFTITDEIYKEFTDFVAERGFGFESQTDVELANLAEAVEANQYTSLKQDLQALSQKIARQKELDIHKHKAEIAHLLRLEIIKRYYYDEGLIEASFDSDPNVLKSVDILRRPEAYKKILGGS
ncbi:MAG: S41 family peptidase [Bacteroidetes bacterium]|nr:MAG: S41 family peptidase [Bacteroidota bacterium]